jgi:hypothetical protein
VTTKELRALIDREGFDWVVEKFEGEPTDDPALRAVFGMLCELKRVYDFWAGKLIDLLEQRK